MHSFGLGKSANSCLKGTVLLKKAIKHQKRKSSPSLLDKTEKTTQDLREPVERTLQTEVQFNSALSWRERKKKKEPRFSETKKKSNLKIVDLWV